MHGLVFIVVFDFLLFFLVRVYSLCSFCFCVSPEKQTNKPAIPCCFSVSLVQTWFSKAPKPTTQNQQTIAKTNNPKPTNPKPTNQTGGWSLTLNFFYLKNETKNGGLSWSGWSPCPGYSTGSCSSQAWSGIIGLITSTPLKISLPETNIAHKNPPVWWYIYQERWGFSWDMLVSGRVTFLKPKVISNNGWLGNLPSLKLTAKAPKRLGFPMPEFVGSPGGPYFQGFLLLVSGRVRFWT